MAKKLTEEYEKKYVEVNTCIEDVHNNGYDQGFEFISQAILKAIDILIEYKIYDISYEVFLEEYYSKYYNWNDIFDSIDNKYLSIIKSTEELDEYRTSRRENRGKWIGGGFGLGGAVQAGALNILSGTAHGVFNLGAKLMSAVIDSSDKRKIFRDPNMLDTLKKAVLINIICIKFALYDALYSRGIIAWENICKKDLDSVDGILKNLDKIKDKFEVKKALLKALSLNPYNEDIYEYIINNKLDETGIVYKIIDYFGISIKKNTEETLNKTYEETAKEMEDEKILDEEQSKVLLNLEKINETTVQSKCNYEELFEHVTAHFQEQGGILAVVDMIHGKVEALWKYGKDTSNIKITANFSAQKDESIQIRLEGSLENAIDNFNVAKKRAEEMTDEILKPINVKAWALTNNKYLIRHRGKRKNITALLTILGGFCGIHKFYIGNWGWGLVYLLLIGTGISLFLSVVEYIYILTLTSDKFNERYNYKKISVFTLV